MRLGLLSCLLFLRLKRGQSIYQLFSCSTWFEYTVVHTCYIVRVDPAVELPHASILSCGFSTGYGAAWRATWIETGSSVAVLEIGTGVLVAIQGLSMLRAAIVIGMNLNEFKRGKGEAFGMTHLINPNQSGKSIPESIKELTGGMGVDCCYECSGVRAALVPQALESTKPETGTTVVVGVGTENANTGFRPCFEFDSFIVAQAYPGLPTNVSIHFC